MENRTLEKLSFETALKGLEAIVEKLSGGSNDLEEMLKLYAEGVEYQKHCMAKLAEAEARIKTLSEALPAGKAEES